MYDPEHSSELPEVYDEIEGIRANIRSLENDDFEGQLAHAKEELDSSSYKMSVNAALFHTLLERSTKLDAAIHALEKIRLLPKDDSFQLNVNEIIASLWEEGRAIADTSYVESCRYRAQSVGTPVPQKPTLSAGGDLLAMLNAGVNPWDRMMEDRHEEDGPSLHATFDGHHTSDSGKVQIPEPIEPIPIRGRGPWRTTMKSVLSRLELNH